VQRAAKLEKAIMKTGTIFLAVLAGVVASTSSANASFAACQSIADPMKRLACYDKAAHGTAPSSKTAAVSPLEGVPSNPIPMKTKAAVSPVNAGPRYWVEVEGGIYGLSRNLPVIASTVPPATTGPTFVPTAPGFIGLLSISTVTNPLTTGAPADFGGGGSFRMGYWLDSERTKAIEGSAFFVQGNARFAAATSTLTTSTFINTTPDVFVGLFNDTTTTSTEGAIREQLYGADANFRMKVPQLASLSNFDVMVGLRYVALDEKLTDNVTSIFSRTFQPGLGLPPPVNFTNSASGFDTFRIRNDFIGPQFGFSAEQHWGRFWVANDNKVAVGAMIEQLSVGGSSVTSTTPTTTLALAGIPLTVTTGAPPVTGAGGPVAFGLFAQGDRSKTAFAVVPSGNIKVGYDINDTMSLTVAYNYLYLSSVGRVADQIASPSDIRQSGFFTQGINFGVKARF
jgi:hypothetical protein